MSSNFWWLGQVGTVKCRLRWLHFFSISVYAHFKVRQRFLRRISFLPSYIQEDPPTENRRSVNVNTVLQALLEPTPHIQEFLCPRFWLDNRYVLTPKDVGILVKIVGIMVSSRVDIWTTLSNQPKLVQLLLRRWIVWSRETSWCPT